MRFVTVPLIIALIMVRCRIMIYVVKVMHDVVAIGWISKHFHCADQT